MPSRIIKKISPFRKPLKVLFVSAEVSPYVFVGGLGQVMKALPSSLRKMGVDARIFMPKYALIDEKKFPMEVVFENLRVPTDDAQKPEMICNVKKYSPKEPEAPVYFLENMEYYEKRANVYGYSDDSIRFALLCRGALEFLQKSGWVPDVINATDWHTGFLPNYLKTKYSKDEKLSKITTVFSIHNLYHQGAFDHKAIGELDFDDGRSDIASFFSERLSKQNFMKRGIIYSDAVNTVSENYSKEILTKDYGEGLDELLKEVRTKVFGILNGIDYKEFNPRTDRSISYNFGPGDTVKRTKNKTHLQKEFNLEISQDIPLLGMVARLCEQKGFDLLMPIIDVLLSDFNLQLVIVGEGEAKYRDFFFEMIKKYPKKIGLHHLPDFSLSRQIFAGCDIFLVPSKFEPCGLTQMEAMHYGAIPIVRKTGGLADTVDDFNPAKEIGTGFVFEKYDSTAFFGSIIRAVENYKHKASWQKLVQRAMKTDFSWEASAKKYFLLYKKALYMKTLKKEN
jgi:starch synthase